MSTRRRTGGRCFSNVSPLLLLRHCCSLFLVSALFFVFVSLGKKTWHRLISKDRNLVPPRTPLISLFGHKDTDTCQVTRRGGEIWLIKSSDKIVCIRNLAKLFSFAVRMITKYVHIFYMYFKSFLLWLRAKIPKQSMNFSTK